MPDSTHGAARILRRAGLALFGVLLALALGEAALRLAGYAPAPPHDPDAWHVREVDDARELALRPGFVGDVAGVDVRYNALGYRGPVEGDAPRRIVVLGDSITYGLYLPYEETFAAQLDERREDADVFSLAVLGWDTVNEVAALELDGLALHPDVVVLQVCLNDSTVAAPALAFVERLRLFRGSVVSRSRVAQALVARWYQAEIDDTDAWLNRPEVFAQRYADSIAPVEDAPTRMLMRRVATELPDGGVWERGWTLPQRVGHFRFGLDRLRALADEHGFGVVVLIVPHLVGQPGEPYPFGPIHDLIRHEAERHDFTVVDPTDAFVEAGPARLQARQGDLVHPDARGHALLAEALDRGIDAL
ncbi:MAG: SGNH/GDSL hydrolase family protein [Sandaracinaceae bacterium]|nr:hypothetical protein [Myxococcales bacterium]